MPSLPNDIVSLLAKSNLRVVFAESCTAGLVSATMAHVPSGRQTFLRAVPVIHDLARAIEGSVSEEYHYHFSSTPNESFAILLVRRMSMQDTFETWTVRYQDRARLVGD